MLNLICSALIDELVEYEKYLVEVQHFREKLSIMLEESMEYASN
jgi:hypothetical protein